MDLFKSMKISSSALAAQRLRMNVLSANMANVNTTQGEDGGPYKRRDVVFSAVPTGAGFEDYLNGSHGPQLNQVKVLGIHKDQKEPRMVFDPSHPHADENGKVAMPNVNIMTEMVNMISTTRSYEANVTALNDAKQLALKALEIGR